MNTPAPTEAHLDLVESVRFSNDKSAALQIAESEARATELWRTQVEELRGALALGQKNCDDVFDDLREERDQLRAEVERLRSDRDCEKRLRKDADEFRENAIARAERAEAELAAERGKLDWVFENYVVEAKDFRRGNRYVYYLDNREDLIVEMKGDAK